MKPKIKDPYWTRKHTGIVTILIGILGNDGSAVLASDSQSTSGGTQRLDSEKMRVIQFLGAKAIVAQAGCVALSSLAIYNLEKLSADKTITDYRTVADLAQAAVRATRDTLRGLHGNLTMDECLKFTDEYGLNFELMVAHIFNGQAFLFKIDFVLGIANQVSTKFQTSGSGGGVAEFLLSEMEIASMDGIDAIAAAAYVVERVKKCDLYCGGPVRCCVLESANNAEVVQQGLVDKIIHRLDMLDVETRKMHTDRVTAMLKAVAAEYEADSKKPKTPLA